MQHGARMEIDNRMPESRKTLSDNADWRMAVPRATHTAPKRNGICMNLKKTHRRARALPAAIMMSLTLSATALLAPAVAAPQLPQEPPPGASAQAWSQKVWESAMAGDKVSLDDALRAAPIDPAANAGLDRFKQVFALHTTNLEKGRVKQAEDLAKAEKEMAEAISKDELSKALRSAIAVQTLGDNLDAALEKPEIKSLITKAEAELQTAQQSLDWLQAQELLYFLRTLHEDTSQGAAYRTFNDELESVNRRVSLLAQYAPRALHELRVERAKRLGDPPVGEFRWSPSMKWQDKVAGIRPDMLKASMRKAAEDHIESKGWRPLLEGGLEELQILASTASLDETFPKLADADAVRRWNDEIDAQLQAIAKAGDNDVDSWYFSRMLDQLAKVNKATIDLPQEVMYREFGDGAMYRLDQFSEIIWPDKLPRFKQATEGAFVGVGILIRFNDAQEIMVVNPLEGTPAYYAGVKPNDVISEVDGESTVGWSLNEAVDRITGQPNTQVTVGLKREGADGIIAMPLTRQEIHLPSVGGWYKTDLRDDGTAAWDWYIDPISRVAYIKIAQFTDDTAKELERAWREIVQHGKPRGLIIDLRYNPGGLLTSAVDVSNMFVKSGVIVSGEDKNGRKAWEDQRADPRHTWDVDGVGVVVLVNQGSASASEIVSGCLQAHDSAVVVGERSFGKGSVQTVHPIASNARLKLTTQYYRLPASEEDVAMGRKGRLVHKRPGEKIWGVDPNVVVKMTPQQAADALELRQKADALPQDDHGNVDPDPAKRPDVMKLLTEGIDPQLETALLILQARALGTMAGEVRQAANDGVKSGG